MGKNQMKGQFNVMVPHRRGIHNISCGNDLDDKIKVLSTELEAYLLAESISGMTCFSKLVAIPGEKPFHSVSSARN